MKDKIPNSQFPIPNSLLKKRRGFLVLLVLVGVIISLIIPFVLLQKTLAVEQDKIVIGVGERPYYAYQQIVGYYTYNIGVWWPEVSGAKNYRINIYGKSKKEEKHLVGPGVIVPYQKKECRIYSKSLGEKILSGIWQEPTMPSIYCKQNIKYQALDQGKALPLESFRVIVEALDKDGKVITKGEATESTAGFFSTYGIGGEEKQQTEKEGECKCGWTDLFCNINCYAARMVGGIAKLVADRTLKSERVLINLKSGDKTITNLRNAWTNVKNLINVFVILSLILIAFANILRIQIEGLDIRRALVGLVVAIILANLSYFICGLILNFANELTKYFLGLAGVGDDAGKMFEMIMENSGVAGLATSLIIGGSLTIFGMGGAFIVAGLLLLLIPVILILILWFLFQIRFYIILLLVAVAPIVFLFQSLPFFPQVKAYANKWWDQFIQWVFMAPISVFVLWLLASWFSGTQGKNLKDINIDDFAILVILLILSIYVPLSMGGKIMGMWAGLGKKAMAPFTDMMKRKAQLGFEEGLNKLAAGKGIKKGWAEGTGFGKITGAAKGAVGEMAALVHKARAVKTLEEARIKKAKERGEERILMEKKRALDNKQLRGEKLSEGEEFEYSRLRTIENKLIAEDMPAYEFLSDEELFDKLVYSADDEAKGRGIKGRLKDPRQMGVEEALSHKAALREFIRRMRTEFRPQRYAKLREDFAQMFGGKYNPETDEIINADHLLDLREKGLIPGPPRPGKPSAQQGGITPLNLARELSKEDYDDWKKRHINYGFDDPENPGGDLGYYVQQVPAAEEMIIKNTREEMKEKLGEDYKPEYDEKIKEWIENPEAAPAEVKQKIPNLKEIVQPARRAFKSLERLKKDFIAEYDAATDEEKVAFLTAPTTVLENLPKEIFEESGRGENIVKFKTEAKKPLANALKKIHLEDKIDDVLTEPANLDKILEKKRITEADFKKAGFSKDELVNLVQTTKVKLDKLVEVEENYVNSLTPSFFSSAMAATDADLDKTIKQSEEVVKLLESKNEVERKRGIEKAKGIVSDVVFRDLSNKGEEALATELGHHWSAQKQAAQTVKLNRKINVRLNELPGEIFKGKGLPEINTMISEMGNPSSSTYINTYNKIKEKIHYELEQTPEGKALLSKSPEKYEEVVNTSTRQVTNKVITHFKNNIEEIRSQVQRGETITLPKAKDLEREVVQNVHTTYHTIRTAEASLPSPPPETARVNVAKTINYRTQDVFRSVFGGQSRGEVEKIIEELKVPTSTRYVEVQNKIIPEVKRVISEVKESEKLPPEKINEVAVNYTNKIINNLTSHVEKNIETIETFTKAPEIGKITIPATLDFEKNLGSLLGDLEREVKGMLIPPPPPSEEKKESNE